MIDERLIAKRAILTSKCCSDGLHMVCELGRSRFRLWINPTKPIDDLRIILSNDPFMLARAEAQVRFLTHLLGAVADDRDQIESVTPYRRQRLSQLLQIHDARADGASVRDVAYACIFRNTARLAGAGWKGSSEKRHTLRLLAAAQQMVKQGYLSLLSAVPERLRIG